MRQRLICSVMFVAAVMPAFGTSFSLSTNDSNFGMLGGTISNTGGPPGGSYVVGNVGATTTITGFVTVDGGPGSASGFVCTEGGAAPCTGTQDSTVGPGYSAFLADYNTALNLAPNGTSSSGVINTGSTFSGVENQNFLGSAGNNVYASAGDVSTLAGITLTFDAQNQSGVVFVIQIDGALTVNTAITFNLLNGALASNIYWIIGGTDGTLAAGPGNATISPVGATPLTWDGNILAGDPTNSGGTFTMSARTGGSGVLAGTINGCVFTDAANTLAGITDVNGCFATGSESPEPGSAALVGLGGLLGIGFLSIRARRKFRV